MYIFLAIFIGVGAAAILIGLQLVLTPLGLGIRWDERLKSFSGKMHNRSVVLSAIIAAGLWGWPFALQAWPVFVGAWLSRKLSELGMDILHRTGSFRPQPRVIQHADGRRALVDARTGQGYQVLPDPSPATRPPSPVARWLNEKV